jgi:hypothetical protein
MLSVLHNVIDKKGMSVQNATDTPRALAHNNGLPTTEPQGGEGPTMGPVSWQGSWVKGPKHSQGAEPRLWQMANNKRLTWKGGVVGAVLLPRVA